MLKDLSEEAAKAGLQLHAGKSKILGNVQHRYGYNAKQSIDIGSSSPVQVLKWGEHTEYLGRLIGFSNYHDAEIQHRISKGLCTFHKYRKELSCADFPLERCRHLPGRIVR